MNAQDKELIISVARDVMGWPALDKPVEHSDAEGTVFFWHEQQTGVKPMKATTYEVSEELLEHGMSKYAYIWHEWNPLEDPDAFMEIVNKLTEAGGNIVTLSFADNTACTIEHPFKDMPLKVRYTAATPGRAVCMTALMFLEAAANYTPEKVDAGFCQHGDDPDTCEWCKAKPQDETLARMRQLAQGINPAYKWVTTDIGGNVYAWTSQPQFTLPPRIWTAAWDVKSAFLGNIPDVPSVVSYRDLILEINQPATPPDATDSQALTKTLANLTRYSAGQAPRFKYLTADVDGCIVAWEQEPEASLMGNWLNGGRHEILGDIWVPDGVDWTKLIIKLGD